MEIKLRSRMSTRRMIKKCAVVCFLLLLPVGSNDDFLFVCLLQVGMDFLLPGIFAISNAISSFLIWDRV